MPGLMLTLEIAWCSWRAWLWSPSLQPLWFQQMAGCRLFSCSITPSPHISDTHLWEFTVNNTKHQQVRGRGRTAVKYGHNRMKTKKVPESKSTVLMCLLPVFVAEWEDGDEPRFQPGDDAWKAEISTRGRPCQWALICQFPLDGLKHGCFIWKDQSSERTWEDLLFATFIRSLAPWQILHNSPARH